jgi:hypothetical protein
MSDRGQKGRLLHNEQLNPAKAGFEMEGRFQCYCSSFAHPSPPLRTGVALAAAFSRHLMAGSLLREHQIFMLALAELRCVKIRRLKCSLFRSLPLLAFLVFLLSDWWEVCATSAAVGGGAPGPVPQERGTGRGRFPPHRAALEVTRPEPRNDRKNTRKAFSLLNATLSRQ